MAHISYFEGISSLKFGKIVTIAVLLPRNLKWCGIITHSYQNINNLKKQLQ